MQGYRTFRLIGASALVALVATLAGSGLSPSVSRADPANAIISNGTVQLGVWAEGHLNVPGGTPSSGGGNTTVGLRFMPTNAEATADGCTCEGWGAADATSAVSGYANDDDAVVNLTPVSFVVTDDTAVSTVDIGSTMRVVHNYHPSSGTANLYQVDVSITNTSGSPIHLLYRRVMDWDIEPTAFDEYVTMVPGVAPELVFTSDDGFASANPLAGPSDIGNVGAFVDAGPADHGALFDFDFGTLDPGWTKQFQTFYGGAATEVDALAALTAVGAQAYSLGQPSSEGGPNLGTPNTFMFAFGGVSSVPVVLNPVDTPANPTPCIGGIVSSRCPNNPPEVNATPTPSGTVPAATATSAPATATVAPPQATATQAGGGAAGVISAPDTGSGPTDSGLSAAVIFAAAVLLVGGAGASAAALRSRRR